MQLQRVLLQLRVVPAELGREAAVRALPVDEHNVVRARGARDAVDHPRDGAAVVVHGDLDARDAVDAHVRERARDARRQVRPERVPAEEVALDLGVRGGARVARGGPLQTHRGALAWRVPLQRELRVERGEDALEEPGHALRRPAVLDVVHVRIVLEADPRRPLPVLHVSFTRPGCLYIIIII